MNESSIQTKSFQLTPEILLKQNFIDYLTKVKTLILFTLLLIVGVLNILVSSVLVGIICLSFLILYPIVFYWILHSNLKNPDNKNFFTTREYSFYPDKIHIKEVQGSESHFSWSKIIKVKENKHFFLLYIASNIAHYIPKHVFQSEQDKNKFIDLVNKHNFNIKKI